MTEAQKAERAEAIERLREILKPGDTVHTILRHVSRSGMQRSISCIILDKDGPHEIDWLVRQAMGEKIDRTNGGIKVGGCGMDMGFHLVYSLSRTLFRNGFRCAGEKRRCPSNDHSNTPYPPRKGGRMKHSDGGYALNHRWL